MMRSIIRKQKWKLEEGGSRGSIHCKCVFDYRERPKENELCFEARYLFCAFASTLKFLTLQTSCVLKTKKQGASH